MLLLLVHPPVPIRTVLGCCVRPLTLEVVMEAVLEIIACRLDGGPSNVVLWDILVLGPYGTFGFYCSYMSYC